MKEFKQEIIRAIVEKANEEKIVKLYDVARELGHKHIRAQDCRDILIAVPKKLPGYRSVKMVTAKQKLYPETASLFTTLAFVEESVTFEDSCEVGN